MKVLLLLVCLGSALAAPKPRALTDDITGLLDILHPDLIAALIDTDLPINPDVNHLFAYLQTPEWHGVLDFIGAHPGFVKLEDFLVSKNVDAEGIIMGLETYVDTLAIPQEGGTGTFNDFMAEVQTVFSVDDLVAAVVADTIFSPDFQELIVAVSSEDTHKLFDDTLTQPTTVDGLKRLIADGVDIYTIFDTIYGYFGWGVPPLPEALAAPKPRVLTDDISGLLDILHPDLIAALINTDLPINPQVNELFTFLQTPEWHEALVFIGAHPGFVKLEDFLVSKNVDAEGIIAELETFVDTLDIPAPGGTGTFDDFLAEAETIFSVDDLLAAVLNDITNSPDFQELIVAVSSEDTHKLFDDTLTFPVVVDGLTRLVADGVDIKTIFEFIYNFLGWGVPPLPETLSAPKPRVLTDDITGLLDILHPDLIAALINTDLPINPQVNELFTFLQTPEWHEALVFIGAHPGFVKLEDFLVSKNVDAEGIIADLETFVDTLDIPAPGGTGTFDDFLAEAETIFSVDDLLAAVLNDITNSPDFQELIVAVSSEDTHKLFDDTLTFPVVVDGLTRLVADGVDIKTIFEFIYNFLGWGVPPLPETLSAPKPRVLTDDITGLLDILHPDLIAALINTDLPINPQVNELFTYLQTPEWHEALVFIGAHPGFVKLEAFLVSKNVDAEGIIADLETFVDTLDIPAPGGTGTFDDFLAEAETIFSVDDLLAAVLNDITNSPDFQELIVAVSSEDTHMLFDDTLTFSVVVDGLKRLVADGVDIKTIFEFIYNFLGWGVPPLPEGK